jgi:hypothetical protein
VCPGPYRLKIEKETTMEATERYVTRKTGRELARQETGVDIGPSTINKDCMLGRGPKAAARYGKRELYLPEEFLRYARSKIKKLEPGAEKQKVPAKQEAARA